MKTLTVRLNSGTDHYDKDFGPPLPRSMYLWNVWGCSSRSHDGHDPRCLALSSLERISPNTLGTKWVTRHQTAQEVYEEHIKLCKRSPGCSYFIHWLVGELEEPGKYGDEAD